jgi:hypothetical protein
MHLVYLDDSRDEVMCVFSALTVEAEQWRNAFEGIKAYRKQLRQDYGIYLRKELHATEFVAGRGRIADRVVTKTQRCQIFTDTLKMITSLPGVRLFNALGGKAQDERIFERLTNRINRTMESWQSHALLICDEGKEAAYTKLVRKMGVHNPIPSKFGVWDDGAQWKNIPVYRVLEDPFFKDSKSSFFVQLVDFTAYALLRRERPLASKSKYGIHEAFDVLDPILVKEACRYNRQGIVRV